MDVLDSIPAAAREAVRAAVAQVGGRSAVQAITPVSGGASGASIFQMTIAGQQFLLRIEGPPGPMFERNPHHFACLAAAAQAGVAPRVHVMDETSGVTISDFIQGRRTADFPGGPGALLQAMGALLGRLQASPPSPRLVDYRELIAGLVEKLRSGPLFTPGLLDGHAAKLEEILEGLDWDADQLASSHNDVHPGNLMFDGQRLWLIDWESAYRNDPMVDVAIVADTLASTPEHEERLLEGWLGHSADRAVRARLGKMRRLTRLYYAAFLLGAGAVGRQTPEADLTLPRPDEVRTAVAEGRLVKGSPTASHLMGKVFLDGFFTGRPAVEMQAVMAALA